MTSTNKTTRHFACTLTARKSALRPKAPATEKQKALPLVRATVRLKYVSVNWLSLQKQMALLHQSRGRAGLNQADLKRAINSARAGLVSVAAAPYSSAERTSACAI
jgi:hypothetical protein